MKILMLLILFFSSITQSSYANRGLTITLKESERAGAATYGQVTLYEKYYALVIGIDKYTNGWPVLNNAVGDAEKIGDALERKGIEVTRLLNPNSLQLKASLEEFYIVKGSSPETGLIVWYAGHGHTIDGEGYIIPSDAPSDVSSTQFRLKALSLRRFGEYVRQAQAKHALAVFDACFSGTIFSTQRALPPSAITLSTTYPVRQFISSGDTNQTVSDDGTFAKLFINAINGQTHADGNLDGYLTGTELGLFLADKVTNLTQSIQTPRYGKIRDPKYDQGDFVFILPSHKVDTPSIETEITLKPITRVNSKEMALWNAINNSRNSQDFEAYLSEYPSGVFATLAKMKIRSLQTYDSPASTKLKTNDKTPGFIGKVLRSTSDWKGIIIQLESLTAASVGDLVVINGKSGISKPYIIKRVNNGKAFVTPTDGTTFKEFSKGLLVMSTNEIKSN